MTRPVFATAALVVIVAILGACLLLGRGPSANVGGPRRRRALGDRGAHGRRPPSPVRSRRRSGPGSSSSIAGWAATAPCAVSMRGPVRRSSSPRARSSMSQSNGNSTPVITATAASVGSHTVRLVSALADTNCTKGDTGMYDWSVSSDGRTLAITAQADTCASRLAALPGTWNLDGCKDTPDGLPGRRRGRHLRVAVHRAEAQDRRHMASRLRSRDLHRSPTGWANSSDWPDTFGLTPSTAYDALPAGGDEGNQDILVVAQATPMAPQSDPCGVPTNKADYVGLVDPHQRDHVAASRPWPHRHGSRFDHDRRSSRPVDGRAARRQLGGKRARPAPPGESDT